MSEHTQVTAISAHLYKRSFCYLICLQDCLICFLPFLPSFRFESTNLISLSFLKTTIMYSGINGLRFLIFIPHSQRLFKVGIRIINKGWVLARERMRGKGSFGCQPGCHLRSRYINTPRNSSRQEGTLTIIL